MDEELISVGQALITKEQYLANKEYYDNSGFIGKVGGPTPSGVGVSISDVGESVNNTLNNIISNCKIIYRFNGGNNLTSSPFTSSSTAELDDLHFVTWFLYQTGYSDLTIDEANDARKTLEYSDLFTTVTTNTTSSDSSNYKFDILSTLYVGDILFFDSYQRNGSVAIYIGNGDFITVNDMGNDTDLVQYSLWGKDELGNIVYTDYMKSFNGLVKRLPRFDEDDYKWYVETTIGH